MLFLMAALGRKCRKMYNILLMLMATLALAVKLRPHLHSLRQHLSRRLRMMAGAFYGGHDFSA
jgi:hypothetical protein